MLGLFVPNAHIPDDTDIALDPVDVVADQILPTGVVGQHDVPLVAPAHLILNASQTAVVKIDIVEPVF